MAVEIEVAPPGREGLGDPVPERDQVRLATILIVDDEPVARDALSDLLRAQGFRTIAVGRGEEAFEWADKVDLVLLDAMLPDRDGWSVCRELKERYDPLLPIIMVTARSARADMVRTFDAKADDYITKPFYATELVKRIGTRLRVRRLEQELAELAAQNYRLYQKAAADAEERAALLRELDHRVRNNLAIIMGLVTLERHRTPTRSAEEALAILENRFRAVILVYDSLRHHRYRAVPLRTLFERLLQRLRNVAGANGRIDLEVTGVAADLDERQAFALTLVLHELVTNALQHAFPDGRPGSIRLDIADRGESLQVTVADDGVGFDPGECSGPPGSGRTIIEALTRGNLMGSITFDSGPGGTTVVLTFPRQGPETGEEGLTA